MNLAEKRALFADLDEWASRLGGDDEIGDVEREQRRLAHNYFGGAQGKTRAETDLAKPEILPLDVAKSRPGLANVARRSDDLTPASVDVVTRTPALTGTRTPRQRSSSAGHVSQVAETPLDGDGMVLHSFTVGPRKPVLEVLGRGTLTSTPSSDENRSLKRKRIVPKESITGPEAVFHGLHFYYIPDNDIAPLRKLRMRKAQDHGATWTRDILTASHVVVDKHLSYKDIETVLTRSDTKHEAWLVNAEYPLDCINFKTLLPADQPLYRVRGAPSATTSASRLPPVVTQRSPSCSNAQNSLELKPPHNDSRKWDHVGPYQVTPLPSNDSAGDGSATGGFDTDAGVPEPTEDRQAVLVTKQDEAGVDAVVDPPTQSISFDATELTNEPRTGPADEMAAYIDLVRRDFDGIPSVNEDENDDMASVIGDSEETSRSKWRPRKELSSKDRFACHHGGLEDGTHLNINPNARTVEVLQKMQDYYAKTNDHWREIAYRKAISTLKRTDTTIRTADEAKRLPGIGQRLADKVEEIATTDRLRRLDFSKEDDCALQVFLGIYDVGVKRAQKWIDQGFRTLDDLRKHATLSVNQQIGIDRYDDLNTRIPREEVAALGAHVKHRASAVDPEVELLIGGSYRRGSTSSGDIDFIVTKKGTTSVSYLHGFLKKLVKTLTTEGFLVAELSSSLSDHDNHASGNKWHGCCVLPNAQKPRNESLSAKEGVWRRIDFLLVPETEYGAALIYFTGNDIFNRSMRLLASKKNMRLNQRGLYRDVLRGPARKKLGTGELLEGRDEKRIFALLGVQWREPHERWC